ncbi:hypothetical protein BKA63DRAFT_189219 [Paraphoma chrysanthemicola]|nr:hypothetical protein BKA63DRAFT_189219 [Paraphoma chrysanthemicola]
MDYTTSRPATPPQLTIEEVLEVLLLCFEAAADAEHYEALAYAKGGQYEQGVEKYVFWFTVDLDNPPEEPLKIPFPPAILPEGVARFNKCDAFAILLEEEADKQMRKFFGAQARWFNVAPLPVLVLQRATNPFGWFSHSVLVVTEENGREWVMDGTPQQFGWPRSTWLMAMGNFLAERVIEDYADWADERKRNFCGEGLRTWPFWVEAEKRMKQLFEELKWDHLATLSREERVKVVME